MSKPIFFLLSIAVTCLTGFIAIRFFGISDDDVLEIFGMTRHETVKETMEPKYQKAYAIEGIAQKWVEDENEDDYVDTGDMLDDFKQVLELSRDLMKMLKDPNR